uniref:Uncharacterized protein n=1 Tax=Salix viminalis TaxID=40686 RepID=A0A6N2JZV2_SALVM
MASGWDLLREGRALEITGEGETNRLHLNRQVACPYTEEDYNGNHLGCRVVDLSRRKRRTKAEQKMIF